jgi:NADPH:quinone reductase-like Zn-dependent oxidoreductase
VDLVRSLGADDVIDYTREDFPSGSVRYDRIAHEPRLAILTVASNHDNLAKLSGLLESGQVAPIIDRTYPLEETPDAIRYMEVEHARAKIVIDAGSARSAA